MLERWLPRQADNGYSGHRAVFVPFALLTALKLLIGTRSMFDAAQVAQGADGIPLSSLSPLAIQEITSMFALLGLGNVMMGLIFAIVLMRYRSLVPLMLLLSLLQRVLHGCLHHWYPGAPVNPHAPGDIVALIINGLIVLGLALCLVPGTAQSLSAPEPLPPAP